MSNSQNNHSFLTANIFADQNNTLLFFRQILEATEQLFRSVGHSGMRGFVDPSLPHFTQLSVDQKQSTLRSANVYLDSLRHALMEGWSLKDQKQVLWCSLKALSLTPASDLFETIGPHDAVEIYYLDGRQIWRNLAFMQACSYTLEEVFCHSWEQRYHRECKSHESASAILENWLRSPNISTQAIHCHNVLTECFSERRLIVDVIHKTLSPLFDSKFKTLAGFVVVSDVAVIGQSSVSFSSSDLAQFQ